MADPNVKPVAVITLDTRSYGPPYCETCDSDVESVIMMTDATYACPDCAEEVFLGDEFPTDLFMAARPLTDEDRKVFEAAHACDDDCRSYGCSLRRRIV